MSLYSITYLSSAVPKFTKSELLRVMEDSRIRNETAGITGILIYRDGDILQVLEGEESMVKATFRRISNDPRHVGIFPAIREPISERNFDQWTMAFRDLQLDPDRIEGFNDILNSLHPEAELDLAPSKVRNFVRSFVRRAVPGYVPAPA